MPPEPPYSASTAGHPDTAAPADQERPHPAPAPVTPAGRTESLTPPGSWNPL